MAFSSGSEAMAAYLIADVDITDAAVFEEYRRDVPASEARYGGHRLGLCHGVENADANYCT
jgi:uncharacterized protein (DUF1330 family)